MGWLSTYSTIDVQECLVFPSLSHTKLESALTCFKRESNNRICPSKSEIFRQPRSNLITSKRARFCGRRWTFFSRSPAS